MTESTTSLRQESRDRYLTYALSVVTGRALPDVRDGLKPVQRRILYAMFHNLNLKPSSSHRKSAAVVGEVLARFHPHGDVACYEAMVRMAQDFSLRYPLVDGQGNFGSIDGDGAAAYRYTEAKLRAIAIEVIGEIDQDTVDFRDNFDATTTEPIVFPSGLPNLLLNGGAGIAVGMATNIPPHNLKEVISALIQLSENPDMSVSRLLTTIKGPDFPTGCSILNSKEELVQIYQSGKGTVRMRSDWKTESLARGKEAIVISSVPYAANKSQIVEKIADLIIDKKIPQLLDIRDESTSDIRIVLELAPGADPGVAMAFLLKHTPLESNFYVNLTALVPTEAGIGRPQLLSLKECLQHFLDFREEVVVRRLKNEKRILLERIHILLGLVTIFDALDEAIKIVRSSEGRSDAAKKLRSRFKLSEIQAFAVVDMRIYQLARTNIKDIKAELSAKESRVKEIDKTLKSKSGVLKLVRSELVALSETYGDKRKSAIIRGNFELEYDEAAYVVKEEVYAIITKDGWLKRIRQSNELSSTRLREGDSILRALPVTTLDSVVLFTNLGFLYSLSVADFPSSSGYGDPVQKILKFKDGEQIVAAFALQNEATLALQDETLPVNGEVLLASKRGMGYVFEVSDIENIKRNGKRVMKVRPGDALASVCRVGNKLAFFTQSGSALSIARKKIPSRNNAAVGVSLMGVRDDDELIAVVPLEAKSKILLTLSNNKIRVVKASDLPTGNRGLKGKKVVSRSQISAVGRS